MGYKYAKDFDASGNPITDRGREMAARWETRKTGNPATNKKVRRILFVAGALFLVRVANYYS